MCGSSSEARELRKLVDVSEFSCFTWGNKNHQHSSLSSVIFFVVLIRKELSIAKHHLQEVKCQQDTSHLGIHAAGQDAGKLK